nr:uncharacterized protein LOC112024185 [Quercus suber]
MKEGSNRISLRLDRAFATNEWLGHFKDPTVHHLADSTSDHCILATTDSPPSSRRGKRRFHFEAMWAKREDCHDVIEAAWHSGTFSVTSEGIVSNLQRCASALASWNQNVVDSEEIIWRQRSKVHWYREGDRNTKFFHARASERRKKNSISGLWNEDGIWCDSKESITATALSYFENIYTSSSPTGINEVINAIPRRVTDEMNSELTKTFTSEEVLKALKQLHPTKAPRPDGMSAIFFHNYWDIVGPSITNMVLNVLNSNLPMTEINKTNISLIPKTNQPVRMTEFRPISLCNTTYKIISKVLANRFKAILPNIISENQSAFTPNRLITDNVLVAFKFMHYLNHKNEGKENYMSIKLDMSKAFDRVEWSFIKGVMEKLGFMEKWIHLIMNCVSSVSYSVLINGEAFGNIAPSRGIRQGDPLSPCLFLLCAKGLSALIHEATRNQQINGISICRGCPLITHLFFADDSLLFCKAKEQECHALVSILHRYEEASRQKINTDKSSVFFSPNTSQELRESIFNILGPMQDSRHSKYLGLPSIIGKSKAQMFAEVKDRVAKKLAGWKGKLLSIGGREILIKAVAQTVPTYTMSCFQLPKTLCQDLESLMRSFWWGQKDKENKIAWVSWRKMCRSKLHGGMGFRNIQAFNLAMLAKQGWRILTNPNSLMARVFKAKYFPFDDVLNSKKGSNPSYAWRSIHNSLDVIRKGTRWRVGNGRRIHIWDDRWLPTPTTHKVVSPRADYGDFPMVSSLIDLDTRRWKVDVINATFLPHEASTILKIPLSFNLPEDCLIWIGNKMGEFTVKSAYYIASGLVDSVEEGESTSGSSWSLLWKRIWQLKVPPKIKIFAWRTCVNGLPTMQNLNHRGVHCSSFCPLCDKAIETITHALLHCEHAKLTWAFWCNSPVDLSTSCDMVEIALDIIAKGSLHDLELFFAVAWSIWWNRNQEIHEDSGSPPIQAWDLAGGVLAEFKAACLCPALSQALPLSRWKAPPTGYFKINTDAAAFDDERCSCIGVVIRDCRGVVLPASSKVLPASFPAEIFEALALQEGVLLAAEMEVSHAIFESDSLSIIQAISEKLHGGEFGHIIRNIWEVAASFTWCSFKHLKREGNKVAHELARIARNSGASQVWKWSCPSLVEHLLVEDLYL